MIALCMPNDSQRPSQPAIHDEDLELARSAALGDLRSKRNLIERLMPRVRNTVCYLAAAHPDADDFSQQALIEVLQSIGSFRGNSSLELWAERIAIRTTMRHIKRLRWRGQFVTLDSEVDGRFERAGEDELSRQRVSGRVAELLQGLKPKHRAVVVLRLLLGYSLEEICDITSSNVNTVKYRLRIGRAHLRRRIERDPLLAEQLKGYAP